MTVQYVLTWEEFMEAHQYEVPTSDWASSVAGALIALATLILAMIFDWATRVQPSMPAVALCFIAAVLMGIAVWKPTVGTWIRKREFRKQARAAYQKYYSSKESQFTFDEQKWSDQVNIGKWEQWSEVVVGVEYQNVIVVKSAKALALVPKRAVVSSDLAKLRCFIFGEFSAPATLRVGLREYFLPEIASLWHQHKSMMVIAHMGGLLISASVVMTLWTNHNTDDILWIGTLVGALLFLTVTTQFWYVLASYTLSWRRTYVPWEIGFSDRGAHIRNAGIEVFSAWSAFAKFKEISPAFMLYFEGGRYYLLPKNCLSAEQQTGLRQFLRANLKAA